MINPQTYLAPALQLKVGQAVMYKGGFYRVQSVRLGGALKDKVPSLLDVCLRSIGTQEAELLCFLWHPMSLVAQSPLEVKTLEIRRELEEGRFEASDAQAYDLEELGSTARQWLIGGRKVYFEVSTCFGQTSYRIYAA